LDNKVSRLFALPESVNPTFQITSQLFVTTEIPTAPNGVNFCAMVFFFQENIIANTMG
jgi:hypothetical protein